LILDALNRSRRETEAVPGIDTQHPVSEPAPAPGARALLPWAALAAAVLVIIWLLVDRGGEEATVVATQPAAPGVEFQGDSGGALTAVPEEARAPAQTNATVIPATASAPQPVAAPDTGPAPRSAEEPAPDPEPGPAPDPAVAQLYREAQTAPAASGPEPAPGPRVEPEPEPAPEQGAMPAEREEPVDLEEMLLQAREEMENARLVDHPAPFLASLSQQTKNGIPTILYQRHDYSSNAAESSVDLNGKTLRNGGSAGGFRVDEILPDSVVLTYRGTQFRLRALNSWVNL
jgi:hypothetical protein